MAFALYLPAQGTLNVSLFAQYNRGDGRASGSWAYVAPDGSEYAVLGAQTGTSIIRIDDPDAEGVGEVMIRSPGVMKGYYRNPEATAAVLDGEGWFRSGDLGWIGPRGELYISGRRKELIVRSGFNVHPPEIEAMLTRHPQVRQAAVVGRPVKGDEEIVAFLLTEPDLDPDDLRDWLKERLVAYKVPQHLILVEAYPTAPTGKILKHKLLTHFADRLPAITA